MFHGAAEYYITLKWLVCRLYDRSRAGLTWPQIIYQTQRLIKKRNVSIVSLSQNGPYQLRIIKFVGQFFRRLLRRRFFPFCHHQHLIASHRLGIFCLLFYFTFVCIVVIIPFESVARAWQFRSLLVEICRSIQWMGITSPSTQWIVSGLRDGRADRWPATQFSNQQCWTRLGQCWSKFKKWNVVKIISRNRRKLWTTFAVMNILSTSIL